MRIIIAFCISVMLYNCEDKQTSKQTQQIQKDSVVVNQTPKKATIEREFPRLTEQNAMDFFLDYEKVNKENKVRITTDFGKIDILLFDRTKFHRANFIFLTKQKYFDGTQFYRVVKNFIIQGGSSDDYNISKRRRKIGKYLLPKDTKRGYTHDRGMVSMPSSEIENPHKLASPYQFFIVQRPGGAKYLDGDYTVFGKVIRGMDVVDKINAVETDEGEWPIRNVYIRKIEIIE